MGANGGGFSFKLMNAMAEKLAGGSGLSPEAQAHQAAFSFAKIVSVSHQAVVFPKTFSIRCALQQSMGAMTTNASHQAVVSILQHARQSAAALPTLSEAVVHE